MKFTKHCPLDSHALSQALEIRNPLKENEQLGLNH